MRRRIRTFTAAGALLALTMPLSAAPVVFTAVALLGAAISMYLLARDYASSAVAFVTAATQCWQLIPSTWSSIVIAETSVKSVGG